MNPSARVTSLEALIDFRTALAAFGGEVREALSSVDMETQRTLDWVNDQLKHWQAAVRRWEDRVFQAKSDLVRRRMLRIGDRPPDCTEQEEALELARENLAHAEEQAEKTEHWLRVVLPEALLEYQGPGGQLATTIELDLPRALAVLEHKIAALEAYLQTTAPVQPKPARAANAPEPSP
jgi:hypothetical protein